MGSKRGKLAQHLEQTKQAVRRYLEYEDVPDKVKEDAKLAALGESPPEQPEALSTLRLIRRFNSTHLWWAGGLGDQPAIWMAEINAAIDAEIEHGNIKLVRAQFKKLTTQNQ